MVIINDRPAPMSFSLKNEQGRSDIVEILPGKNEVNDRTWQRIKTAYAAKWSHYGQFLREWKPLNIEVSMSDELTGGPLSQFARKDGFESLTLHDALETIENTSNRQILEGYLSDETSLGRNRKQVKSAIQAKIAASKESQADRERAGTEWNEIEARWQKDHPGQAA
jgi:hypothetical protein